MKTLKKSIAVFVAALAVSSLTALPISAQAAEPVKTYTYDFDTLKSLIFKCDLDYTVSADEKNGTITFSSKNGDIYGDIFVTTVNSGDGKTQVYPANISIENGVSDVEYCVTICSDAEVDD